MPMTSAARGTRAFGTAAAAWGLLGAAALLLNAVVRLAPVALEAFVAYRLDAWQWLLALGGVAFMGYLGYRGFQQGFSPRVVVRALHLARNPRPLHVILAPLFCMGLIHASRRRLVASWVLLVSIVGIVLVVRRLPQPYRGIIDVGVVFGLGWLVALAAFAWAAVVGSPPRVSPELRIAIHGDGLPTRLRLARQWLRSSPVLRPANAGRPRVCAPGRRASGGTRWAAARTPSARRPSPPT